MQGIRGNNVHKEIRLEIDNGKNQSQLRYTQSVQVSISESHNLKTIELNRYLHN